jgi:hypothetical protein
VIDTGAEAVEDPGQFARQRGLRVAVKPRRELDQEKVIAQR